MAERREHQRLSTRMRVEFGTDEFETTGLATDISIGGMFVECRHPPEKGTRVHLHVLDKSGDFYVEGVVVRRKTVPRQLQQIEKAGAGIRFLTPAELVTHAVPAEERTRTVNAVRCSDASAAEKLLREQVASRLILVPTADPPPSAGEMVEFTIELAFGNHDDIEGLGRVVQLLGGERQQAVLEIQDADAVRAALEAI